VEFEPWYRELHPKLVAWLVVAASDVELAQDVAAEAFTRAYSSWARVAALESPDGWVWTVAYNVLRRHFRRRALESRILHRAVGPEASPAPGVVSEDVWDAVRSLPLRQRTAIALRYVLDLPQAQIAAVMGVAPGTVSATLVAARKRLAETLAPADADAEGEIDCDAD
jgi:RNA polymerase sigma-70 factor (ECF subfamily)